MDDFELNFDWAWRPGFNEILNLKDRLKSGIAAAKSQEKLLKFSR